MHNADENSVSEESTANGAERAGEHAGDAAQVSQLREALLAAEGGRPHDYIKSLVELAEALPPGAEKVELFSQAAELYTTRFKNQAEAVRAYEAVLEVDPHHGPAIEFLVESYQKRRDWEKLIALRQRQAEGLDPVSQLQIYKEIAVLASERIKKPSTCIELWGVVLEADPNDVDALRALTQLFERDREYEKLADVLESLVEATEDVEERKKLLQKLGQIAGDRLKDDRRAAEAYRQLLVLEPDDRRWQEQLKKRYVTLGKWDELEVFYAQSDRWDEFIRVLESNESRAESEAERVTMLMKVAELWMTQKGKPDRAIRAYEKVLSIVPDHLEAAERLIPLYQATNNARGLADAYEAKLRHTSEPTERGLLLRQAAELYLERANDKARALECLVEAFTLAPDDEQARVDVEHAASLTASWNPVVEAYKGALSAVSDPTSLRLRTGRVLLEELKQVDDALVQYHAVTEEEPGNEVALAALEGIYRSSGRSSELLEIYQRRVELCTDPEQQRQLLFEMAKLHEADLEDPSEAIGTYEQVLAQDPTDEAALAALDRLYLRTARYEDYAETLRRRIEFQTGEQELVDLKFRLAEAEVTHLGEPHAALDNYREILIIEPEHEGARKALEQMLSGPLKAEAASILENIYEASGQFERLIAVLEIAADASDDRGRKVELLRKIAVTAAAMLGDPQKAFDAQAGAVALEPGALDARDELEAFAQRAGAWPALEKLYTRIATGLADADLSRDYWLRLASIQQQHGSVADAAASYSKLLEFDPSDAQALVALESLLRGGGRWDELVDVYRRRIELSDDDEARETLYCEMAGILDEHLSATDDAVTAYREILAFHPTSHVALTALETLLSREKRWPELAENLESQILGEEAVERQVQLMLRLARLRQVEMGDAISAIEGYRQVLERDPFSEQAIGALEQLAQDQDNEVVVAEILEPLYRDQGNYSKLIAVYEIQERREVDSHTRVGLLHQIANLYEDAAGDVGAAFETYCRALAVEPGDSATWQAVERMARATGRYQDLATHLEQLAEAQEEPDLASQLLAHAARVMEQDVGNPARAIELYRKVLSVDPVNVGAATSLQALYQATEQFDELSLILQRKVGILEDADEQKEALFQAATIEQDVLNRPEKAIAIYEKALELDPEDIKSVDSLIDLHLGLEQWPQLLAVQAKKADLTFEPYQKKVILYQMGSVYERELGDRNKAIDTYQRVLELDPDDLEALGRLDALHQESGNWTELLGVLAQEAELTADAEEAIGYQFRIAELYEKQLGDTERAVELYQEILNIQPGHAATLSALEQIKDGDSAALAAANVLEPVYEAMGEYQRLIGALEVQAKHVTDVHEKVGLLHRIASLYEDGLLAHGQSFEVYTRAVECDSSNEDSLIAVERLAMALGRWSDVAELYRKELEKTDDVDQKVELGMRVAQLYEVQLDDVEKAVSSYQMVLSVSENQRAALVSLDRIFTANERWGELAAVLERQTEVADTPEEILELKYRLGRVNQYQLENVPEAIRIYGEILAAAPEHGASREALEGLFDEGKDQLAIAALLMPLYEASAEWEKLAEVRKAQLEHTVDPEERRALFYKIAEDHEENLVDIEAAFEIYGAALNEFPRDPGVGEEIERLAGAVDDGWVRLAMFYADIVSQEDAEPSVQALLGARLGRVYEEELADVDKAKESYRFALSVMPTDERSLANLDRILTGLEEWTELAEVLEQRVAAADNAQSKVELLIRVGAVYEEQLQQLDDAQRVYRRVFDELEPDNRDAIEALERILTAKESWEDLAKVYERQLELSIGDTEEAEIRAKMARLSLHHLGDLEAATEGWRRVLELRGEDGEALQGLADLYEHKEQWAELADVLERHYDIAETDDERVLALSRRAKLSDQQLGRLDEALDTWQRVLDIDFSNPPALLAVADIWRRRQNTPELIAALHRAVDNGEGRLNPEQVVAVQRELGQLYSAPEGDPFAAIDAWNHLLEVDSTDAEAIDALDQAYRAEEQWDDVVRVKMLRASALTEPDERVLELLEVSSIWDKELHNADGATEAYNQILDVEPLHEQAFEQLQKLHKAAGRWEELIELYLGRLEHLEELPARSEIWRRIARVFEERVEDNEQAFVALDQAFKDDFHDDLTLEYLGRMAHATGRWKELIAETQQLLEEQTDKKDRIRICLCLGKWYGEDLGMMEYANSYYEQVVQMDPGSVQVMRQMANIYRLSGNWMKASETLRQAEQAAVKNEDRKVIYVDLGDLLRKNMGETEQSVSYYKRALAVDPHLLSALDALEGIYEERGEHSELAQTLKRKIEAISNPDDLAQARLKLAELYERELRDPERAAEAYQGALAQGGATTLASLRGLERVYDGLHKWTELVDVLEQQLASSGLSERERVGVLLKLAKLQEEQFLRSEVAAERLEQALKLDPTNQSAYESLARCYRRLKRWDSLIDCYNRHLDEIGDPKDRLSLLADIGEVYSDELEQPEAAIDAYQKILEIDDNSIAALDALAKLYDKRGDAHESIECLTRVADLTTDGTQRVEMYYRIGKQQLERLQDSVDARYSFEKALDLEPSHQPSLAALRAIAQREEDWDATARYLEQEQTYTDAPRAKARLLVELGRVRGDKLGEHELALSAYEQAIENDPECEDAAGPLLDSYSEQGRWQEALPLAELLARRVRGQDRAEQHHLNNLLGRIHAELGNNEEALKAYQTAYQFDVTSQESIRGIAEVGYRLADWPTALTNYQKVLTSLAEHEVEERTDVYYRLGTIKRQQGQLKQAINNFEKALALNGEHRQTLESLVEIYEKQQDWPQAAEYKRQILDAVLDDSERYELLVDIGEVWGTRAKSPLKAIEALEEARTIRPDDHVLLHKLLKLYQEAEHWPQMIDMLHAISELEPDPERKSRYSFTMAQLYRDKIEDADRAVELFNDALDLNPGYLEAFERINKILTHSKNWKQLERNYRKMLHRIAGKDKGDLEHELWYQLGLIYRDRIQDQAKALDAFKVASHTKPEDIRDRRILSELYEVNERYDEAIEQQLYILNQDPLNLDPYRSLYRLYLYKRAYDPAWCVAAAMAFMRKADAEEQRFYEDWRPQGILKVQGRLNNEYWVRYLLHPDLNLYVSKIFEAISGAALKAKIAQLGAAAPNPEKRIKGDDFRTSTIQFARTFGWSAQVLGMPIPELHIRNDQPIGVVAVPTDPRGSEAGRGVLSGLSAPECAFVCGKHLASYRPELYIRNLFPAQTELTVMLFAGVLIAEPNTPLPQELASNVRATAAALSQHMDAQSRESLANFVRRFVQEGAKVNIKQWSRGAELTGGRAGLLLAGDLEVAKKVVSGEKASPDLAATDKMKDLLVFSVGPEYAALREALGVSIRVE